MNNYVHVHIVTLTSILTLTCSSPYPSSFFLLVNIYLRRFMQHQPQLVDLGLARLKIFEYFCLPSIVKQTSQEFIWIIRTDPDLDQRVKEPLLDLLKGHPNYLLVASNENPEGFRHALAIEDITIDSLWSGDLHLLQQLHDAAQSRIVLETRLDGDDGLHTSFVEYIQAKAIEHIIDPFSWTIWCLFNHMEWQYSSPFQSTADVAAGFWVGVRSACCVTPGLTMVYGKEVNRDDLPRGTHQNLHKVLATCNNDVDDHCLRRFRELMPGAIRARTPTSAGMANVIIGNHGKRDVYKKAEFQANVQNEIWKGVEEVFFVSMEKAKGVRNYIRHNLKLIAADNLKGQCTKGHSCKSTSKDILKGLMADVLLARE